MKAPRRLHVEIRHCRLRFETLRARDARDAIRWHIHERIRNALALGEPRKRGPNSGFTQARNVVTALTAISLKQFAAGDGIALSLELRKSMISIRWPIQ